MAKDIKGDWSEPHSSYPTLETKDKIWAKADWARLLLLHTAVWVQSRCACDLFSCYQCNDVQIFRLFTKKGRKNIKLQNSKLTLLDVYHASQNDIYLEYDETGVNFQRFLRRGFSGWEHWEEG